MFDFVFIVEVADGDHRNAFAMDRGPVEPVTVLLFNDVGLDSAARSNQSLQGG